MNDKIHATARQAKIGEKYTCSRCNGKGHGTWHVQFGMCFKCLGMGYLVKQDLNEIKFFTNLKVKVGDTVYLAQFEEYKSEWLGDTITFNWGKLTMTGTVVAKHVRKYNGAGFNEEKETKNYKQVSYI
jgi:hypothetical protein